MNRLRVLYALCFGSLVCAAAGFARGSLSTGPHGLRPVRWTDADHLVLNPVNINHCLPAVP